jgi:hypothetical protein
MIKRIINLTFRLSNIVFSGFHIGWSQVFLFSIGRHLHFSLENMDSKINTNISPSICIVTAGRRSYFTVRYLSLLTTVPPLEALTAVSYYPLHLVSYLFCAARFYALIDSCTAAKVTLLCICKRSPVALY